MGNTEVSKWLQANRVINVSGTMTALGASIVAPEILDDVQQVCGMFVDMNALQARASQQIAKLCGAEGGFVSACAASGISLSIAGCMTGLDLGWADKLPDTNGLTKTAVVLLKGHSVTYGSQLPQLIRTVGATPIEVGAANHAEAHQLRHALEGNVAAAVWVVSHHTVQSGLLSFPTFVELCREKGVPVIVDAASEYDLKIFLSLGAQIAVYSAHKFLSGLTAGIVAGDLEIVRAGLMHQTMGIGRPMKVGKEGVVGTISALERWTKLDHRTLQAEEYRRLSVMRDGISSIPQLLVEEVPDPTGNPITRLRVSPLLDKTSVTAGQLALMLKESTPNVIVRDHHVDLGYFEIDPCNLVAGDELLVVEAFQKLSIRLSPAIVSVENQLGARYSAYDSDQIPSVDVAKVPWMLGKSVDRITFFQKWPEI